MAVAEGRNGKVQIAMATSDSTGPHTVAELGNWSISGISRNMIDYTAFGDTVAKMKPGTLTPGTISFEGHYDGTDTTGQVNMITWLTSGTPFYCASSHGYPMGLRLWANDDTSFDSYGFWALSTAAGSEARIYINGLEASQDKDGLGTISFNMTVSGAMLQWSTST